MSCIICANNKTKTILSFRDDTITLVKCNKCGLVSLNPINKPEVCDDYEELNIDNFFDYMKNTRIIQYKKDIEIIKSHQVGGELLDVGSGFGIFLDVAQCEGYSVAGVEPSKTAIEYCKKKYPTLDVIEGEFDNTYFGGTIYNIITLWSVLEHTVNPDVIIKKASTLLSNGGLLCIRVPNYSSLLPKIIIFISKLSFGKINWPARLLYQLDYTYKHFYHFSLKTLKLLLENNGFTVLDYYKENSLNQTFINERLNSNNSAASAEMGILKNPLAKNALIGILRLCDMFNVQDEIVVFCKKN